MAYINIFGESAVISYMSSNPTRKRPKHRVDAGISTMGPRQISPGINKKKKKERGKKKHHDPLMDIMESNYGDGYGAIKPPFTAPP